MVRFTRVRIALFNTVSNAKTHQIRPMLVTGLIIEKHQMTRRQMSLVGDEASTVEAFAGL